MVFLKRGESVKMETRNLHLYEVIVCVTTPEVKTIPLFLKVWKHYNCRKLISVHFRSWVKWSVERALTIDCFPTICHPKTIFFARVSKHYHLKLLKKYCQWAWFVQSIENEQFPLKEPLFKWKLESKLVWKPFNTNELLVILSICSR